MESDKITINPSFLSAEDAITGISRIARDMGYVMPFDALMPVACYARENGIVINWDPEKKLITTKKMDTIDEETVTVMEFVERAYEHASNLCHKENPNCAKGLRDFMKNPKHPTPVDPTDFQSELNKSMFEMVNSSEDIDLITHAALMLGYGTGAVQELLMKCYEGKGGMSYKELMQALAETLLAFTRLLTVTGVNMTEIMLYVLSMIDQCNRENGK